jgi:hypothetical protein
MVTLANERIYTLEDLQQTKVPNFYRFSEKKRVPCPVCHEYGWPSCGVFSTSKDGKKWQVVGCTRVRSNKKAAFENGTYLHTLPRSLFSQKDSDHECDQTIVHIAQEDKRVELASVEQRSKIYRSLVESLSLHLDHKEHLLDVRQLDEATISRNGYVSVEAIPTIWEYYKSMDLSHVHGFSQDKKKGLFTKKSDISLNTVSGILIPYRDERNQILGFQNKIDVSEKSIKTTVRVDQTDARYNALRRAILESRKLNKYNVDAELNKAFAQSLDVKIEWDKEDKSIQYHLWSTWNFYNSDVHESFGSAHLGDVVLWNGYQVKFSVAKYIWLTSPGIKESPISTHVAMPRFNRLMADTTGEAQQFDSLIITEGALKADIIINQLEKLGKASHIAAIAIPGVNMFRLAVDKVKKMRPQKVYLAFDSDFKTNENVSKALNSLKKELLCLNIEVYLYDWDKEDGKGLDDLLINKQIPRLLKINKK